MIRNKILLGVMQAKLSSFHHINPVFMLIPVVFISYVKGLKVSAHADCGGLVD